MIPNVIPRERIHLSTLSAYVCTQTMQMGSEKYKDQKSPIRFKSTLEHLGTTTPIGPWCRLAIFGRPRRSILSITKLSGFQSWYIVRCRQDADWLSESILCARKGFLLFVARFYGLLSVLVRISTPHAHHPQTRLQAHNYPHCEWKYCWAGRNFDRPSCNWTSLRPIWA